MRKYRVGILGATGIVGQRFVSFLENHPWFEISVLAASSRSAGKKYSDLVASRWAVDGSIPTACGDMVVLDAVADCEKIADLADFVFCAVDMPKAEVRALEEQYARLECPVVSNTSAHRATPDVPMVIPEINADHLDVIPAQRKRLGTKKGFISVKSNCSLQSYVPALHPLLEYGLTKVLACTYQAISGAGKTFETWPEMVDNVIPYIGGEEEKCEIEPLKIWGKVEDGQIVNSSAVDFTSQCIRVPVTDGHFACVFADLDRVPSIEELKEKMRSFEGEPQRLNLPSAPKQFIHVFDENDMPQTSLHRNLENGMAVSVGRVRPDSQYSIKFVSLSHNTLRGAAGGAVLLAELLAAKGYFD